MILYCELIITTSKVYQTNELSNAVRLLPHLTSNMHIY